MEKSTFRNDVATSILSKTNGLLWFVIRSNDIIIGEDVHPPVVPLVKHTILKSSGFGG